MPKKTKTKREELKRYRNKNHIEVGIDEAGRGPLLGRVYVGAVILPPDDPDFDYSLMRDSKKLSVKRRLEAYEHIKEHAINWTFAYSDEKQIDKENILQATFTAMHRAIDQLLVRPDHLLVDGDKFRIYTEDNKIVPHLCVEEGDNTYASIAAASIVAKVEHDKYIDELCDEHPELEVYGLRTNRGYGTAQHIAAIKQHGITKWHRRSFGPCK